MHVCTCVSQSCNCSSGSITVTGDEKGRQKKLPPNTLDALIEFSIFELEIVVIRLIRNGGARCDGGAGCAVEQEQETELIWIPSLPIDRSKT